MIFGALDLGHSSIRSTSSYVVYTLHWVCIYNDIICDWFDADVANQLMELF